MVAAEFSPDGRRIVTASTDRTARVWDVLAGEPITPPLYHSGEVFTAGFSPDGNRLITAGADLSARIWALPCDRRPAEDLVCLASRFYRVNPTPFVTPSIPPTGPYPVGTVRRFLMEPQRRNRFGVSTNNPAFA